MAGKEVFRVSPIKPAQIDLTAVLNEILGAMKAEGDKEIVELQKTTQTWSGARPRFAYSHGSDMSFRVGPVDDGSEGYKKWSILNAGAKPHLIAARRAPFLRFRTGGFGSKTTPRLLGSGPGARATGPLLSPRSVRHPGIRARNWTDELRKRRAAPYARTVKAALARGLKKARRTI